MTETTFFRYVFTKETQLYKTRKIQRPKRIYVNILFEKFSYVWNINNLHTNEIRPCNNGQ